MDSAVNSESIKPNIAFFLQDLDGGGAERAIVALAGDIAKQGYVVDLVIGYANSDYRAEASSSLNLIDFNTRSPLLVFFRLISYLKNKKPTVIMSALDIPNIMLVTAAKLVRFKGKTVISQRAALSVTLCRLGYARRILTGVLQRICFTRADVLISNSHAAAKDVQEVLGMPSCKIATIHNAIDVDRINRLAHEPFSDLLPENNQGPLVVTVGSLTKRKDMGTLIKSFQIVKEQRQATLVIIGEGSERPILELLIRELNLGDCVSLIGFDVNPYKWLKKATVFVSSSTGEGFPNVIAEALALGQQIVATDCLGDTAVLLGHGKWGRLVPVGEPELMAEAIMLSLDDPNPPDGRIRAADFTRSKNTSEYLSILSPKCDHFSDVFN